MLDKLNRPQTSDQLHTSHYSFKLSNFRNQSLRKSY